MLFDGSGADVEVGRDLLVAASLHEQTEHLLVARRDFDFVEIDHRNGKWELALPFPSPPSVQTWGRDPL
jgi:hypothetical protein